jgi:uncharacterized membrane protein AbrB (regulator of aidB expression)
MKKFELKVGCLPSVLSIVVGVAIIVAATSSSENGGDYSVLVYIGFIVSLVGIALMSLVVWDFVRSKLGLKRDDSR